MRYAVLIALVVVLCLALAGPVEWGGYEEGHILPAALADGLVAMAGDGGASR